MEINKDKPLNIMMGSDRKIKGISCEHFSIILNGLTNAEYATILAPLGIKLTFQHEVEPPASGIIEGEEK